jgi:hypothetical protein
MGYESQLQQQVTVLQLAKNCLCIGAIAYSTEDIRSLLERSCLKHVENVLERADARLKLVQLALPCREPCLGIGRGVIHTLELPGATL